MDHPPSDLERFEAALKRGDVKDVRSIWTRVKAHWVCVEPDWVPHSTLAYEERCDPRTLLNRIGKEPFVKKPANRVVLVDRKRFLAYKKANPSFIAGAVNGR